MNKKSKGIFPMMSGVLIGVVLTLVVVAAVYFGIRNINVMSKLEQAAKAEIEDRKEEVVEEEATPKMYGLEVNDYDIVDGKVKDGEVFSVLMSKLGAGNSDINELVSKSKGVFDMRRLKAGYEYHAFYTRDEESPRLAYMVYDESAVSYVRFSLADTLKVEVFEHELTTTTRYANVVINNSLWVDAIAAGVPALAAAKIADIYAWTIDFFGVQKGDSFEAVYTQLENNGKVVAVENVLYCDFKHAGRSNYCYYFEEKGTSNTYWNEKGESMRKAFLKAPLSFTRISSGFSYNRRHPVTRKVRPHTGIDYAAPTGTPVMSIGDGTVVFVGRKTNEGNMVKIKHNSTYQTAYLHLSRFGKGIKTGARVSQGQVIGYVGSTGRSTGPHLDFRIWKNGTPINPLTMSSPPATPISKEHMDAFRANMDKLANAALTIQATDWLSGNVDALL
ncbi:MAG: M23 family metallopeptidase [Bacteroidales bacterium]|nr:M23 family metallopeptidase [Bacteroidales bacterium]